MRFEYFLTLLKNCEFIIGNSSCGIREAYIYKKIAIDIGNRQNGRYKKSKNIIHVSENKKEILWAIENYKNYDLSNDYNYYNFGKGDSNIKFMNILLDDKIWTSEVQKGFIDIDF